MTDQAGGFAGSFKRAQESLRLVRWYGSQQAASGLRIVEQITGRARRPLDPGVEGGV